MGMIGDDARDGGRERVQDFIFARELAEVYLLLDHLSGRSDKSLTVAIGDGKDDTGSEWIQKICAIGWPPKGTAVEQSAQAATLLLAKDRLNAAAKPANGASIVFTLMVAGDDEVTAAQSALLRRRRGLFSRFVKGSPAPDRRDTLPNPSGGASKGVTTVAAPPGAAADPAQDRGPRGGGGENGGGNSSGVFGGYPPSRISLARLAYPGLIGSAGRFHSRFNLLLLLLFVFLIFTCGLSWHITAGRAILARLDAIETARAAIQKRIADAEVVPSTPTPGILAATGSPPTPQATGSSSTPASAGSPKPYVQRYCERASRLPPPKDAPAGVKIAQFEDATQLQICDQLTENRINYSNAREDIADWLAPWGWLKSLSHRICGGKRCLNDEDVALNVNAVNQQQWAAVMVDVLATAVLPLCYGFLGAGAAVVRNIWGKMRDSLLSPRDLPLSLGQLALGAVIGACIGLFVTPSGVGSQGGGGLTGSVTLTPSALSFIAGFGVEGIFVALESLIKRVFNIPDQKP